MPVSSRTCAAKQRFDRGGQQGKSVMQRLTWCQFFRHLHQIRAKYGRIAARENFNRFLLVGGTPVFVRLDLPAQTPLLIAQPDVGAEAECQVAAHGTSVHGRHPIVTGFPWIDVRTIAQTGMLRAQRNLQSQPLKLDLPFRTQSAVEEHVAVIFDTRFNS